MDQNNQPYNERKYEAHFGKIKTWEGTLDEAAAFSQLNACDIVWAIGEFGHCDVQLDGRPIRIYEAA